MPQLAEVTFPRAVIAQIASVPTTSNKGSLWEGPSGSGWNGGVTQSMLSRYLSCPERFRVQYIEGWHAHERFSAPMDFGNGWHAGEEALAKGGDWQAVVDAYFTSLLDKYPMQRSEVRDWHAKCNAMFPLYVEHWARHPDVVARTPLLQEEKFDVKYPLASGRLVRLRGKWDSVDIVEGKLVIQENKTKSGIDAGKIQRQLRFDLQTLVYDVALQRFNWTEKFDVLSDERINVFKGLPPVRGVRYNVIRRSAHKSVDSMLKKITEDRDAGRIDEWFARWNVEISAKDVERFERQCLRPVLENMCDDFEHWKWCFENKKDQFDYELRGREFPKHACRSYRMPYGVYSPIAEGGFGDVDTYLENGSTSGLRRATTLFPELA